MDTIYDAKILIVDDNAELLALLCEQLRGAGYGHIRTAQRELPKAAPLPAPALRQSSRS